VPEARQRFRRIRAYSDLPKLVAALRGGRAWAPGRVPPQGGRFRERLGHAAAELPAVHERASARAWV